MVMRGHVASVSGLGGQNEVQSGLGEVQGWQWWCILHSNLLLGTRQPYTGLPGFVLTIYLAHRSVWGFTWVKGKYIPLR